MSSMSQWGDLNPQPDAYRATAPPLCYTGMIHTYTYDYLIILIYSIGNSTTLRDNTPNVVFCPDIQCRVGEILLLYRSKPVDNISPQEKIYIYYYYLLPSVFMASLNTL